jgi:uncharacterized membrane protein
MNIKRFLIAGVVAAALFAAVPTDAARKGGGNGGGGTASDFNVTTLPMPDGAVNSRANAISEDGNLVVGDAYWNATIDYPNKWYAVLWTRDSSGTWQARDLRDLWPDTTWSWGTTVNDSGTVVLRSQDHSTPSRYQTVVLYGGVALPLGEDTFVNGLSSSDEMSGSRAGSTGDVPLYWGDPFATPSVLPTEWAHNSFSSASAGWFIGSNLHGAGTDTGGRWLVKWSRPTGNWEITATIRVPDAFSAGGMNADGLVGGTVCQAPCLGLFNYRAASWQQGGDVVILPTPNGPYGWVTTVLASGEIAGTVEASNGTDMIPVIWPSNDKVVALPLPSRGVAGLTGGSAGIRIVGSATTVVKGKRVTNAVVWEKAAQ